MRKGWRNDPKWIAHYQLLRDEQRIVESNNRLIASIYEREREPLPKKKWRQLMQKMVGL